MAVLAPWTNFYVIVGTAAGGLTGLTFVVISLIDRAPRRPGSIPTSSGLSIFTTPTVAHFGFALFVSLVLSAPWPTLDFPACAIGLAGLVNVGFAVYNAARTYRLFDPRIETLYQADGEDWFFYGILPLVAYLVLVGSAIELHFAPSAALFVLGGAVVLLIYMGIRNAWDVVTYLAIEGLQERDREQQP
jgi:hypothetical protein